MRPKLPERGDILTARTMRWIIQRVSAFVRGGPGIRIATGPGGEITIVNTRKGGGRSVTHPWKVFPNGDYSARVTAGSIMGFIPKGDGSTSGPFALPMVQMAMDYAGGEIETLETGFLYARVATTSTLENTAGPIPELGDDIIESHLHRPSAAPVVYFSTDSPALIVPVDSSVHFLIASIEVDEDTSAVSVTKQYLRHNPTIQLDENLVIWG